MGSGTRGVIALAIACAGCARAHPAPPPPSAPAPRSPLSVFAEGLCPKLKVYSAGARSFLVYGTYGLDEVAFGGPARALQAIAELRGGAPVPDPGLVAGLPSAEGGYAAGDLELSGTWPDAFGLVLVEAARPRASSGALFERRRTAYTWEGTHWLASERARQAATPGMRAPDLPEADLCAPIDPALHFFTYAAERLPSGDTLVAGRCEDSLRRARGGVRVATFFAHEPAFRLSDAPASPLFDGIVNLGILYRSRGESYLYAYPPYGSEKTEPYLVRFDGHEFSKLSPPIQAPVVAMAAAADGALWIASGWRTLWRVDRGQWTQIPLPAPLLSDKPVHLRLLDVHAAAGAVWVHAAYPIELEGDRPAGRGHVLFTTLPGVTPRFCDRRRPARDALSLRHPLLHGAEEAAE